MKKLLWVLLLIFPLAQESNPQCTSFCLTSGNSVYFGNTLDWYFGDGLIVVNKRNVSKTALGFSNPAKWTSKYGSITINQWGREFPARGMNEAGLAVGEMTLSESKFPNPDSRPAISNPQWIQYQLDNCATVQEVIETNSKIRMDQNEYHSHFFVADSSGNCATIEWLNGELVYHTGTTLPLKVLTNSTYESLIEFYAKKTPHPVNDYCTLARFYRVANMIENYHPETNGPALDYAWNIHASVTSPDRTKWILLFDLKKLRFYFKTNINMAVRFVDLKSFNYSCGSVVKMVDANANLSGDICQYFIDYDSVVNLALIKKIAELHGPVTGAVSEWYVQNSAHYPETTKCGSETGTGYRIQNFLGYELFQNYPNPFNPSTVISYQLPQLGNVKLRIYDAFGREVETLVDAFQGEGKYSLEWNPLRNLNNQVNPGIFFYSLTADRIRLRKKMIFTR